MGIKIEKGVPMVSVARTIGRPPKYPFGGMDVWDSFPISNEDLDSARSQSRRMARLLGRKFQIDRDASGSWRAWRVE